MPEGDSVLLASRRMRALVGRTITASDLRVPQHATADLVGQQVTDFAPRGKHMLLRTDAGWTLRTQRGEERETWWCPCCQQDRSVSTADAAVPARA